EGGGADGERGVDGGAPTSCRRGGAGGGGGGAAGGGGSAAAAAAAVVAAAGRQAQERDTEQRGDRADVQVHAGTSGWGSGRGNVDGAQFGDLAGDLQIGEPHRIGSLPRRRRSPAGGLALREREQSFGDEG